VKGTKEREKCANLKYEKLFVFNSLF